MYASYLKRLLDVVASLVGIIVLLPVMAVIICVLLFLNRGKPFFTQSRPGWHEREFKVIKFKTMTDDTDADGNLLSNFDRTTKFGAFLRRTSLDELPQLFNVLKGDMSLIGPRPLLFKYIPLYSAEQKRRHLVRPGVTGWAQINGRNAISWARKFELDVYYVDNISFLLDMKILFLTVLKVISSDGVNAGASITMPPFDGTN